MLCDVAQDGRGGVRAELGGPGVLAVARRCRGGRPGRQEFLGCGGGQARWACFASSRRQSGGRAASGPSPVGHEALSPDATRDGRPSSPMGSLGMLEGTRTTRQGARAAFRTPADVARGARVLAASEAAARFWRPICQCPVRVRYPGGRLPGPQARRSLSPARGPPREPRGRSAMVQGAINTKEGRRQRRAELAQVRLRSGPHNRARVLAMGPGLEILGSLVPYPFPRPPGARGVARARRSGPIPLVASGPRAAASGTVGGRARVFPVAGLEMGGLAACGAGAGPRRVAGALGRLPAILSASGAPRARDGVATGILWARVSAAGLRRQHREPSRPGGGSSPCAVAFPRPARRQRSPAPAPLPMRSWSL